MWVGWGHMFAPASLALVLRSYPKLCADAPWFFPSSLCLAPSHTSLAMNPSHTRKLTDGGFL